MENNQEYKIVFKGRGLEELKELAKSYNISQDDLGQVVVKAIKLLRITKEKKSVTFQEGNQEFTVNTKKL